MHTLVLLPFHVLHEITASIVVAEAQMELLIVESAAIYCHHQDCIGANHGGRSQQTQQFTSTQRNQ